MRPPRLRLQRVAPLGWQWVRHHPRLADGVAAGLATVVALSGTTVTNWAGHRTDGPGAWAILLAVASAAPLAVRRRYPFAAAMVISTAYFFQMFLGHVSTAGGVAILFVTYSLGAYGSALGSAVVVLSQAVASVAFVVTKPEFYQASGIPVNAFLLVMTVLQFPGVWVIGRAIAARRAYLADLEDRADRLERTAAAEVRAALAEERARVARELHDVVAHHVSVMTVQAAAARRTLRRDPERSAGAMRAVEETGRSALDEMRRIVGALRTADHSEAGGDRAGDRDAGEAELTPQAGTAELTGLVDRARAAGLDVELTVIGRLRKLPPSVDLAVYRVVQEALTNTMRHAGPTQARVTLRFQPDAVDVAVVDDGVVGSDPGGGPPRQTRSDSRSPRQGHGLIGMRERVSLNGGTLRAGPRLSGGFEVSARLPIRNDDRAHTLGDVETITAVDTEIRVNA